jgi:hypothetical protein
MTTTRRYIFHAQVPEGSTADECARAILAVLTDQSDKYAWFELPAIDAMAFGIVEFAVTIKARDQWYANTRARKLLVSLRLGAGLDIETVEVAATLRPAIHTNRGRQRAASRWSTGESGHPSGTA